MGEIEDCLQIINKIKSDITPIDEKISILRFNPGNFYFTSTIYLFNIFTFANYKGINAHSVERENTVYNYI